MWNRAFLKLLEMCQCKDKCSCKSNEIKLRGPRGFTGPIGAQGMVGPQGIKGDQGPAGPQGPQGPQGFTGSVGPQGSTGPQGIAGIPTAIADTTTIDLTYTGGILTADIVDTGWHDLLGFDHYINSMTALKPEARRIGKVIYFRGQVVIPLDNPTKAGNVVPFDSSDAYYGVQGCTPYEGTGGVTIDSNNQSFVFNKDVSVIPAAVLNPSIPFDGVYTMGLITSVRPIELTSQFGTCLTGSFVVGITSAKKLYISALKDAENLYTLGENQVTGGAPLRYITSNVRAGEFVPNFISANSFITSMNTSSSINQIEASARFPAIPPTPGSIDLEWTFDCDAGDPNNLGGFSFRLDGLTSFID